MQQHTDHDMESLRRFCEGRKRDVLDWVPLEELATQLGRKRERLGTRTGSTSRMPGASRQPVDISLGWERRWRDREGLSGCSTIWELGFTGYIIQ